MKSVTLRKDSNSSGEAQTKELGKMSASFLLGKSRVLAKWFVSTGTDLSRLLYKTADFNVASGFILG